MSETASPGRRRFEIPLIPKLVITLTIAGLLSGLTLVAAYQITLPVIEANKAEALRRAVFLVLPGATRMQPLVWRNDQLLVPDTVQPKEEAIYAGYDSTGAFLGYAIPSSGPGYQDVISLLYGFTPGERRVVGMQILESRETPGLGDKIFKDADFVANFRSLAVDPEIVLVKEEPGNPNEVDAITGATISSRAVVNIINAGNQRWFPRLPEPGQEPPLAAPGGGGESPSAEVLDTQGGGGA